MSITSFRTFNMVVLLAILGSAVMTLTAQSGRQLPKGSPPVATPTPTQAPATETRSAVKPSFILKVFSDIPQTGYLTFPMPERMHKWVVERLRKTTLLDVRDGGSVNRRDAIAQAKAETEVYVVLLELHSDPFAPHNSSTASSTSIYLTVYHPVSAKIKFSRTLALGQNSTRLPRSSTVLQACNPGVYGNDLLLLEASLEAADSVLGTFNVPRPPLCRGAGI